MRNGEFAAWVAKAKANVGSLVRARYLQLEHPSEDEPPRSFAKVDP